MKRRLKIPLKRADGSVYGKVGEVKDFPASTWDQIADSAKKTLDEVSSAVSDDEMSAHERMDRLEARIADIEKAMGKASPAPNPPPPNPPETENLGEGKPPQGGKKNGGKQK